MPVSLRGFGPDYVRAAANTTRDAAQRLALQLKAQFNNVTDLKPQEEDYTLMIRTKCSSCHEEHSKTVGVTPSDQHEMTKGARGSANLVMSCSVSL